jgi:hypothetical protein
VATEGGKTLWATDFLTRFRAGRHIEVGRWLLQVKNGKTPDEPIQSKTTEPRSF